MKEVKSCAQCGRALENPNATCLFCSTGKNITEVKKLLCLTYCIWGPILFVALSCNLKADSLMMVFIVLGFASAYPIFVSNNIGAFLKIFLTLIYYAIGTFVIFFVGWASICQFCPTCS